MSLLPARMKKIQSKMKDLDLECLQHVSHYKHMLFFFRRSRAAYSEVSGLIRPNFELIQDFIVAHVTCKNEEDTIKNEVA